MVSTETAAETETGTATGAAAGGLDGDGPGGRRGRGGREGREAPLGQPVGSVRAVLAGAIVATFLLGHLGGALILLRAGAPESALALLGALAVEAGTVTGFYFGARQIGA